VGSGSEEGPTIGRKGEMRTNQRRKKRLGGVARSKFEKGGESVIRGKFNY